MKRLHILVLTDQGRGHVYPAIPLCHELSKRGHRITYAVNRHYLRDVEYAGAEALIWPASAAEIALEEAWNDLLSLPLDSPRWFSVPDALIRGLHADTGLLFKEVLRSLNAKSPDVVLYDQHFYPGYVVSRRLGCPRIRISGHFAQYKNFLFWRNGVSSNPEPVLEWASRFCSFLSEEGIDTDGVIWPVEDLNIHFVPDAFQYQRPFFDERFCFAGRSTNRLYPKTWNRTDPGRPVILMSGISGVPGMHEASGYFGLLVDALADTDFHCVLLSDRLAARSGPLPNNIEICPTGSPLQILPHAALLVCHGGMGSTLEAIYHGVPVLALPFSPSADEIASRVVDLGVGVRMLRNESTPQSIRETVVTMLGDSSLRERLQHLRCEFERSVGIRGACDRIERFAGAL